MNKIQKITASAGVVLIFLMGLFPPWRLVSVDPAPYHEIPAGYHLLFAPPAPEPAYSADRDETLYSLILDFRRLAVQWVTSLFVLAALLYLMRDRTDSGKEDEAGEEDDEGIL